MNSVPFTPDPAPATAAEPQAQWLVFEGGRLLVPAADPVKMPVCRSLEELGLRPLRTQFVGTLGPRPVFSAEVAGDAPPPAGWVFEGLRRLLPRVDAEFFALASRAFQVKEWDRCHQFCGRCGAQTAVKSGERCRECLRCGELFYPRLSPVVMILIRRGHELLLARSPRFPPGMYSALAGFVEPGETLEQAAAREVREEVGVEIARLRYFGSQSWPFPHSLMIAFLAEHAGGEIRLGDPEIEDAGWYPPERLPALPHALSIARRLIDGALARTRSEGEGGDGG